MAGVLKRVVGGPDIVCRNIFLVGMRYHTMELIFATVDDFPLRGVVIFDSELSGYSNTAKCFVPRKIGMDQFGNAFVGCGGSNT